MRQTGARECGPDKGGKIMIMSGWINITITILLAGTLAVVIYHLYGSRKETAEKAEQPKYRMLEDDEE